jgi:hypothetical protein
MTAATRWSDCAEVRQHLRLKDPKTLRGLMRDGEEAKIPSPFVNAGSRARPYYRWDMSQVDAWFVEVCRWRASKSAATSGSSGGETLREDGTPRRDPGGAPTRRQHSASGETSSDSSPSASAGSPGKLVRFRHSGKPR